jgi:hypothetical protein
MSSLRIEEKDGAPDLRCDLLEHLQPFRRHCRNEIGEAGGISPWTCQALHEAASHRIGYGGETIGTLHFIESRNQFVGRAPLIRAAEYAELSRPRFERVDVDGRDLRIGIDEQCGAGEMGDDLFEQMVLLIPLARGAPLPLAPPCNRQRPFLVLDKMDATYFMLHSQRSH